MFSDFYVVRKRHFERLRPALGFEPGFSVNIDWYCMPQSDRELLAALISDALHQRAGNEKKSD